MICELQVRLELCFSYARPANSDSNCELPGCRIPERPFQTVKMVTFMNNFMISFNTKYNVILVNDYHRAHKEHKLILGLDLKKINGKKNFLVIDYHSKN